jgi:hypothetical protein
MRLVAVAIASLVALGCGGSAVVSRDVQSRRERIAAQACLDVGDVQTGRLVPSDLAVEAVAPLQEVRPDPRGAWPTHVGASIVVRAAPGLTAAWLDRRVSCRVARCVAGYDGCPIGPTHVSVRAQGAHFVIDLRAVKRSDASSLLERARLLAPE